MAILLAEYVFAAKVEATYGTDATPNTTLNAMRVKAKFDIAKVDTEEMDYDSGRSGAKGSIEKSRRVEGNIDDYLAGSGTANIPPANTPLLKAAGLSVVAAADHVAITLADLKNLDSITGKFFRGLTSQTHVGARMDWEIELSLDALPKIKFPSYMALYAPQVVEGGAPSVDLSAFKNPKPLTPVNFVKTDVFDFNAAISKVMIKGNNEVIYSPESQSIEIIARKVTIDIELQEPSPGVKDFYELIGSYGVIDIQKGIDVVDEGHIFEALASNAQLANVTSSERNKISYLNCAFVCVPTAANNEIAMKMR
jgi:hypothetical protein